MTIQHPEGEEQFPKPFAGFDERPRDSRGLRVVLAGAAGVAVIAGGAAGFIWLGSAPSADASLITPAGSTSAPAEATSPQSSFGSGSAFGGRDIFANTVAPTTTAAAAEAVDGAQVPVATGAVSGATTGTTSSGTKSTSGTPGGRASSSGSTGTATTKPVTPATTAPTPTAEVPWTAPDIRLISADAAAAKFWVRDEPMTVKPTGAIGRTTTVFDSYFVAQSTKVEEDLNGVKTEKPVSEGYVVLRAGQGVRQGWVLKVPNAAADALALPDAAVGNTKGTIRVYEVGSYGPSGVGARISVNGASPVVVKSGDQVPGTRFTYQSDDAVKAFSFSPLAQEASDYAVLSDDTGRIYFGTFGAGEDAGIRY